MDQMELYNISEDYMELINPFTPEKMLRIGEFLELGAGQRIIAFGCGFGEVMALWAEAFGIEGVGIELRNYACERARTKFEAKGLQDRLKVECMDGSKYQYLAGSYDVAACIGASFIWGGYRETIKGMHDAIHETGKLVIGEPYRLKEPVPEAYLNKIGPIHSEFELVQIAREEGYDIHYMVRASHDDWDRYEASNWFSLSKWLARNPDHPDFKQVVDWYHEMQDDYLQFGRDYIGWAVYILNPMRYSV